MMMMMMIPSQCLLSFLLLLVIQFIHPISSFDGPPPHPQSNDHRIDDDDHPPSSIFIHAHAHTHIDAHEHPLTPRGLPRTHSARGQVAVIDGVIGGGHLDQDPSTLQLDPDDRHHQTIQHYRPILNLIQSNSSIVDQSAIHLTQSFNLTIHSIEPSSLPCSSSNSNPSSTQFTGYIHLQNQQSDGALFFWFIQARNNPDQAPLILWLNGGPGSSSMIGLFQENGPCRIRLDSSGFDPNPQSWNENANLIYIDQPIGTGYSYGKRSINTTAKAVIDLYDALQALLSDSRFKQFIGRPFGVWTESYGGHFGPVLVDYILQMNLQIPQNNQTGNVVIPINSLGIGNGLVNPLAQYASYISYARSNPYNQILVPTSVIEAANEDFLRPSTGCRDLIQTCQANLRLSDCRTAQEFCNRKLLSALVGDRDVYDVRQPDSNQYPPDFAAIINTPKFKTSIGVPLSVNWTESNEKIYLDFFATGDWMLDSSRELERVINAGVRTLIYAGDADFIVNYQGVEALVGSLNTKFSNSINSQNLLNWTVDGELAGVYKTAESFSYLRVFEAGHEVPAYGKGKLVIGRAAKVFFDQTISNQPISSTNSDGSNPSINGQPRATPNRATTNDGRHSNDPRPSYRLFPLLITLLLLLLAF